MMSYSVSLLLLLLPFTQALVPPPMLGACLLHQAAFQGDPQPSDNLVCELADAHCDDDSLTAEQWLNTFMVGDQRALCEEASTAETVELILAGSHPHQNAVLHTIALESVVALSWLDSLKAEAAAVSAERRRRLFVVGLQAAHWAMIQSIIASVGYMDMALLAQFLGRRQLTSGGAIAITPEEVLLECDEISSAICNLDLTSFVQVFTGGVCETPEGFVCVVDQTTFTEWGL